MRYLVSEWAHMVGSALALAWKRYDKEEQAELAGLGVQLITLGPSDWLNVKSK